MRNLTSILGSKSSEIYSDVWDEVYDMYKHHYFREYIMTNMALDSINQNIVAIKNNLNHLVYPIN